MTGFAIYPSLKDQVVLVTGGAKGIGQRIVAAFCEQGARVAFIDVDHDAANDVLKHTKGNVYFYNADLCNIEHLQATIKKIELDIGSIDVLVNNAAHDDRHDWRDVSPKYWDERININLRHMFFAIQSCAPEMIRKKSGSIINIGSNSWWECGGGFPAYATAKSAVHGLTRTMARELGKYNIRVNTVVPGWIMTERQKELWVTKEALDKQLDRQCIPTAIDPIYVARMVLFLASQDAAMCTAGNYMVEAGSI